MRGRPFQFVRVLSVFCEHYGCVETSNYPYYDECLKKNLVLGCARRSKKRRRWAQAGGSFNFEAGQSGLLFFQSITFNCTPLGTHSQSTTLAVGRYSGADLRSERID
jgi:hypothetical protein